MHITLTSDVISTALVLIGAGCMFVSSIVYERDATKLSNTFFLFLGLSAGFWGVVQGAFLAFDATSPYIDVLMRVFYSSAIIVPFLLFLFAVGLGEDREQFRNWKVAVLGVGYIAMVFLVSSSRLVVDHVLGDVGPWHIVQFGPLIGLYVFYAIASVGLAIYVLFKEQEKSAGIFRTEVRKIIASIATASILAIVGNLLLPLAGFYEMFFIGPIIAAVVVVVVGYQIVKYNFWSPKLVLTEFFIAVLFLVLVSELAYIHSLTDFLVKGTILALVSVSSVFLVKSVKKEIETKEEIEKLLKDLEDKNELLKILDREKSEFMRIASHHLREPLTSINGFSDMILGGSFGPVEEKPKGAIQRIFESSKRLAVIIEDFMNISRIETGEVRYDMTDFDLGKMLDDLMVDMRSHVEKAKLKLEVNIPEGDYMIHGDFGKLRQVFSNLIDNSVKYTPAGGLRVALERKRDKILFSVKDTGIGMNLQTLESIFKKFSRAKEVSKVYTEGTGLGLFVAKEIVDYHKGKIWAESPGEGKGSSFFVELDEKNKKG